MYSLFLRGLCKSHMNLKCSSCNRCMCFSSVLPFRTPKTAEGRSMCFPSSQHPNHNDQLGSALSLLPLTMYSFSAVFEVQQGPSASLLLLVIYLFISYFIYLFCCHLFIAVIPGSALDLFPYGCIYLFLFIV